MTLAALDLSFPIYFLLTRVLYWLEGIEINFSKATVESY